MSTTKTFKEVKKHDIIYAVMEFRNENGMVEEIKPVKVRVTDVNQYKDGSLGFAFGNNPLGIGYIDIHRVRVDSSDTFANKYLWICDEKKCADEIQNQYHRHIQTTKHHIESTNKTLQVLEKNLTEIEKNL